MQHIEYLEYAHACTSDYKVGMSSGMAWGNHCLPLGLWILLGIVTRTLSHPASTCLEVRGHPVRGNPHGNLTRPGDSGNWTCNSGPSCPPNTLTNHILIEFQWTCKNLVQFCYSIFLTDVPMIPVKWSAVVTSSVWKHIHELADLNGRK